MSATNGVPLAMTIPTVGPTGDRDNVYRLGEILSMLIPAPAVVMFTVAHDDECECATVEGASMDDCTCDEVGVLIELAS